ncbi:hypothetical protein TNCV_4603641 [Trichonephila clavipes]|nr:hypothetical protein TNCV_4603641 [Trichonephila clavipes]
MPFVRHLSYRNSTADFAETGWISSGLVRLEAPNKNSKLDFENSLKFLSWGSTSFFSGPTDLGIPLTPEPQNYEDRLDSTRAIDRWFLFV